MGEPGHPCPLGETSHRRGLRVPDIAAYHLETRVLLRQALDDRHELIDIIHIKIVIPQNKRIRVFFIYLVEIHGTASYEVGVFLPARRNQEAVKFKAVTVLLALQEVRGEEVEITVVDDFRRNPPAHPVAADVETPDVSVRAAIVFFVQYETERGRERGEITISEAEFPQSPAISERFRNRTAESTFK